MSLFDDIPDDMKDELNNLFENADKNRPDGPTEEVDGVEFDTLFNDDYDAPDAGEFQGALDDLLKEIKGGGANIPEEARDFIKAMTSGLNFVQAIDAAGKAFEEAMDEAVDMSEIAQMAIEDRVRRTIALNKMIATHMLFLDASMHAAMHSVSKLFGDAVLRTPMDACGGSLGSFLASQAHEVRGKLMAALATVSMLEQIVLLKGGEDES